MSKSYSILEQNNSFERDKNQNNRNEIQIL